MNTFIKATSAILVIIALHVPYAYALRCGDKIISEGDSAYKISQHCDVEAAYRVQNDNADIQKVYMKQNGMVRELIIIDGELREVNSERE